MISQPLVWSTSPYVRSAAAVAAVALLLGAWTGRGEVALAAAPLLAWAHYAVSRSRPEDVDADLVVDRARCTEGEHIQVTLRVGRTRAHARPRLRLRGGAPVLEAAARHDGAAGGGGRRWVWRVAMNQWGRHSPGVVELELETAAGGWVATRRMSVPTVVVAPHLPEGDEHLDLLGVVRRPLYGPRPAAIPGAGTEFLGVRPWAPGEQVGRLAWSATLRTGRWHVPTYAAERSQDVVLVVDAIDDVASATASTTDRAVRAATALASAHLAAGDRVAVVLASPELLWIPLAAGDRHLLRVVDLLATAGTSVSELKADVQRVPRRVLTPGALVVVVTALASPASLALVADVRRRGHPTVVVEVDPGVAVPSRPTHRRRLIRLWLLERELAREQLRSRGVVVVTWAERQSLAEAVAPARRLRLAAIGAEVAS